MTHRQGLDYPYGDIQTITLKQDMLLVSFKSEYYLYQIESPSDVSFLCQRQSKKDEEIAHDIVVHDNKLYLLKVLNHGHSSNSQELCVTVALLDSRKCLEQPLVTQCFNFPRKVYLNTPAGFSAEFDTTKQKILGILMLNVFNPMITADEIYIVTLTAHLDNSPPTVSVDGLNNRPAQFGTNPAVKIVKDETGKLYFLQTITNGACHCGLVLNNGNLDKCGMTTPRYDDPRWSVMLNIPGMMHYSFGTIDSLFYTIGKNQTIGPCHKSILHAKFATGHRPRIMLLKNETTGNLRAGIVNEGINFEDVEQSTRLMCGSPSAAEANAGTIVFQQFDIVPFEVLQELENLNR